tara:strand:+ start:141 stop:773 length:633 start_codon:yes stop_codon:yes gene_type:complete
MASNISSKTKVARQLYLYGAGDGKRIVDTQKLAAAAGVHPETIRTHLPKWEAEAEEILASSSKSGLGLKLSADTLKSHQSDMDFLRDQLNQVKFELDNLAEVTAKLEGIADRICQSDEPGMDKALRIFEDWLRACGSQRALRTQFLAMQKQWTALGGVIDMKDVSVVREKEMAKGRARMELEEEKAAAGKDAGPRPVGGGVFGSGPARLD